MNVKNLIFVCSVAGLCLACSPRAISEAKSVVAQADSLWHAGQMYGVDVGDSATLAQAYETLGAIPLPFREGLGLGSSYARSCYHYGRLLRAKEDPVAAMQVFIAATHSHTRDYHILGRVYSNMGDIAHLANEFELSYDMYKRSGDMYLKNGDTLLYYYDLNNMAFELAEQGKKEETFVLLSQIDEQYPEPYLCAKIWETKADAYLCVQQYDSSIYCINKLNALGYNDPTYMVIKAQAYNNLGEKDSALFYAETILNLPNCEEQDQYNMLYIILNYDTTLVNEELLTLSARRSDIETDVLIPLHNKWAMAVQLLEQDLTRKPDLRWLYAIILTLFVIGVCIYIYMYRKHKRQELLTQKIDILEQATSAIQEKHLELTERYSTDLNRIENEINSRCTMLQTDENIKKILAWKNYKKMCNIVDKQFYLLATKLRDKRSLKETEVRICILTLLNCGSEQMAVLLYKSPTSIGTLKRRVAKKLGTTSGEMRTYLIENVCLK